VGRSGELLTFAAGHQDDTTTTSTSTTVTSRHSRSARSRTRRPRPSEALKGRKLRDSVVLTRYWLVGIPERGLDLGARADDSFFNRVEALLAVYEAHGRFRFDPNDQWMLIGEVGRGHPLVDAATELAAMGIKLSSSLVPQPGMSPAMELQVTRGIHVDRESVNWAVEDRANDAGNLAKLRDATHATARHLFVPMYPAALMEFWAVEYIEPASTPVLPPEVTRAWVVGGANDVLYVEPPNDWDRVPYDSRAMSDPERWKAR
jgi:hypothetical protein